MPIEKEILDMFEFSRNQKNTSSIDNHFDEWPLSQQRSGPTDQLTLSMHQYLSSQAFRRSVGTPIQHILSARESGPSGSRIFPD